jgi:phage-related protein
LGGDKLRVLFYKTAYGREPVREYINDLGEYDKADIIKDIELIEKYGIRKAPIVTRKLQGRHFKGKLWEIKTGMGHQQRIFYCIESGKIMVLLHACKKQKESGQSEDLNVALKRMKEVL